MKREFMMTIVGPDRLGLIKELAHQTNEFEGVWLRIKATRLEGQFSALIKVSINDQHENALKTSLESNFPQLRFFYSEIGQSSDTPMKTVALELDCNDRPGLIGDLNKLLMNLDLNVEHMESHRYAVTGLGGTVFSSKLELQIAENTSTEVLAEELQTLAQNVRVHVL